MTNQAHLLSRFRLGGSYQRAAPRAEYLKSCGTGTRQLSRSDTFTQINLPTDRKTIETTNAQTNFVPW